MLESATPLTGLHGYVNLLFLLGTSALFVKKGMTKNMLVERAKDDRRKYPRYTVDWKASVKMGENEIYHDHIYDLSLGGAGIYADKNIITGEPLVILIDTPLPHFRQKKVITRIECVMCHTVLSSHNPEFHIGVHFLHFQGIEKHLLAEALFSRPALQTRRIH